MILYKLKYLQIRLFFKRWFVTASMLIPFVICLLGLSGCKDNLEAREIDDLLLIDPEVEIVDDVVMSRIDSLGLVYKLSSPRLIISFYNRVINEEYPEGVEIEFYDKANKTNSSISAGYAFVNEKGVTTLKKDVHIISEKGYELETSHLIWDRYYRKIETDKMIRLIKASGDTTYGFGLEANEDFSRFRIKKGFADKRQFQNLSQRMGIE